MNLDLRQALRSQHGILARSAALAAVGHSVLDHALRSGRLLRPYPQVYLDPRLATDRAALVRAALVYAGGRAVVSHLSALEQWDLPVPPDRPIHLLTDDQRHLLGTPGLRVHRRPGSRLVPPEVLVRAGLPVTRLETTIVDSWPLLSGPAQRAPVIEAVGRRMTTPARLAEALDAAPRLAGRRHLVQLIRMLAAGCRSPLEVWGYRRVFTGGGLSRLRRQVPIGLGPRTIYLDLYDDRTRVNFELDGAAYHASPADRERDLRRDAALAGLGVTVVRFTHNRLVREPAAVRREALAILAAATTRRAPVPPPTQ